MSNVGYVKGKSASARKADLYLCHSHVFKKKSVVPFSVCFSGTCPHCPGDLQSKTAVVRKVLGAGRTSLETLGAEGWLLALQLHTSD